MARILPVLAVLLIAATLVIGDVADDNGAGKSKEDLKSSETVWRYPWHPYAYHHVHVPVVYARIGHHGHFGHYGHWW